MVKRKKRTRITRSGKNCVINCAIQGVRLIWKQKIWLAICEFLWSLTNQNAWFVTSFCTCQSFLISTLCTNFVFLHSKNFKFLHCLGLIDMLPANQNGEFFSCILLDMLLLMIFQNCPKFHSLEAWPIHRHNENHESEVHVTKCLPVVFAEPSSNSAK